MSNESVDAAIQAVGNIDLTESTVQDIERIKKHLNNIRNNIIKALPPSGKQYVTKNQGKTGLLYMLENDVTVKQVWAWLKDTYKKDDQWVKEAKKLSFYYSKELYIELLDNELIAGMRKGKLIRQSTFTNSSSYNHLLRQVHTAKEIYIDGILNKELIQKQLNEISLLSDRVNALEDKVELLEISTDFLLIDTKVEAKLLRDQGVSQKDLAAKYGVTTRTIRNWINGGK